MSNVEPTNKFLKYFKTKSVFDTFTKALDSDDDSYKDSEGNIVFGTPEIKWQDICFIEEYKITSYIYGHKIYTHGKYYNCGDIDDAINLSYALDNNVHGLADALDVAQTIRDIGKNATVENVLAVLREEN